MALLEIDDVSKTWIGAHEPVLDGVSLSVEPGCFAVVEGANGTGKTTLMRIVAGLLDPDRGTVRVAGLSSREHRARFQCEIGMASAGNAGLYARLSARQNLDFGARIAMLERGERAHTIRDHIERFGLTGYADRRVDRLSMGQRQRVRLAAAFLHTPAVVLLDEPATSLDEDGIDVLADAIRGYATAGRSVVWFGPAGDQRPVTAERSFSLSDGALTAA